MAFCVSGAELTNQLKVNQNRGKPFVDEVMSRCRYIVIITSHCLAMVVGPVKYHAFFLNNPCYRSYKDTNTEYQQ